MNVNEIPFALWMEESIQTIVEQKAKKICICAILPDGSVFTGYAGMDAQDKAIVAHHINSDVTMDIVLANIETVKEALEGLE